MSLMISGFIRSSLHRWSRELGVAALVTMVSLSSGAALRAAEVIELTQTGCQFLESEHDIDHGYKTASANDCVRINKSSGDQRLAKSKVLQLKPGEYIFRVSNRNVPYELGFWVREKDYNWKNPIHIATKTSVSGGGLVLGKTQDYAVSLKPGEYVYSCPLNPTPNYRLVVSE
jgi:hypothetical protein